MQKNTEDRKKRQRREAIRGVALFGLLQAACVVCFIALCLIPDLPQWAVILFAALAVASALPMVAALVVLRQRFHEIQGGELDAARQY